MTMKVEFAVVAFCGLTAATVWAASESPMAERPAQPVITGLENAQPDIQDHFADLLAEGFDATGGNAISVSDDGYEKFVIFDTGSELHMYLLVQDENGYDIAIEVAVDHNVSVPEGEEIELVTTLLHSNPELINRSARLRLLQKSIDDGDSLGSVAMRQVQMQEEENTVRARGVAIQVDCAGSGTAVCCGFSSSKGVRIICVCNTGSNNWVLCFDSKWQA